MTKQTKQRENITLQRVSHTGSYWCARPSLDEALRKLWGQTGNLFRLHCPHGCPEPNVINRWTPQVSFILAKCLTSTVLVGGILERCGPAVPLAGLLRRNSSRPCARNPRRGPFWAAGSSFQMQPLGGGQTNCHEEKGRRFLWLKVTLAKEE